MVRLDEYLRPEASYERLLKDYQKHGSLVIAVDFDNTLYDYHNRGESYEMVRQLIRDLYKEEHYIIIWTGNEDWGFVKYFLAYHDVPYHSINENAPHDKSSSRKIHASAYLDDRAGLIQVYNDLIRLLNETRDARV